MSKGRVGGNSFCRAAPETGGMSMAHDTRYYRSDDYAHGDAAPADRQDHQASDPLAELARLIGQTDPFADLRRQAARAVQQDQRPVAETHDEGDDAYHHNDHHEPAAGERDYSAHRPRGPAASYYAEADDTAQRQANQQLHSRADYLRDEPGSTASRYDDTHYADQRSPATHVDEPRYQEPLYADARSRSRFSSSADAAGRFQQPARYAEQSLPEPHYESPGVQPELETAHAAYDDRQGTLPPDGRDYENDSFYENLADDEQDFYDDEPTPRRRKVWMTAAAVCALAVVGSASAFGYRAIFGKSGSSAPPPVITANASPIKVVPPAPAADPQAGKINYDRFGDKGQGEKVVVREEQPVDVNAVKPEPPAPAPTPPAAAAPPAAPTTTAALPPVAPAAPALASSSPASEPKKVRTVTIKPEQSSGLDSLSARSAAVQSPLSRSTSAPAQGASQSNPVRTASAPPNVRPPAEPSIAGGFMVQVSSQKSEADAKASYKTLQAKFPNQLQNRSAVIRKAEVSGKGTFYRAQVGPFSSSDQANEFCNNLKAAGGQCMVQKN